MGGVAQRRREGEGGRAALKPRQHPVRSGTTSYTVAAIFKKRLWKGIVHKCWSVLVGGVSPNTASTTSKITVCGETSLQPSYFEKKPSGVEGTVG